MKTMILLSISVMLMANGADADIRPIVAFVI